MKQVTVWMLTLLFTISPLTNSFAFSQSGIMEENETEPTNPFVPPVPALEGAIDPGAYILGPADQLIVVLRGGENKVLELKVLPEGTIILPNIGSFPAAGLKLSDFKEKIDAALRHYYKNVEIDCQLAVPRTFLVNVLGEVNKPGPVNLRFPFRVSTALMSAGGITETGSYREIELRENGEVVQNIDIFSFLHLGEANKNPVMTEGQSLYVPKKQATATLNGEVKKPGAYEILAGETITDLIRFGGGLTSRSAEDKIVFERLEGNDSLSIQVMSYEEGGRITLRDRDRVVVPDFLSYARRDFVNVLGGGGRTGAFYLTPNERLRDFLLRIGRFDQNFDLSRAVLERQTGPNKSEYFHFDVNDVLNGDAFGDTLLKHNDVIAIPFQATKVYVLGEVMQPGEVPFFPGFSAERYIGLAGGPSKDGSVDRLSILSEDGKKRKGNRNSLVYRGETILVNRKTSKILGSLFIGMMGVTSLIISIIALNNSSR